MNGRSRFNFCVFLVGLIGGFWQCELPADTIPSDSLRGGHYDFSALLKFNETELLKDPLDLDLLFKVADLRLLTLGHAASRELLGSFIKQNEFVTDQDRIQQAQEKLVGTLSRFRLEEAQSAFLRGELEKKNGDRTAALALYTQALRLEPENLVVLREKNLTEFDLELYNAYYSSLNALYALLPFQKEWRPQVVEAHLKFKAYAKISEILEARSVGRLPREDLVLAAAYLETGKEEVALGMLRPLIARLKDPTSQFLVQFYLGRTYTILEHPNLAKIHFLRAQRMARNLPTHRWDPFETEDKSKEIPQWLTKLDLELPLPESGLKNQRR